MPDLRSAALEAARKAAQPLSKAFAAGQVIATTKTNHHDLVSDWDKQTEQLLKAQLDDGAAAFWGEETGRPIIATPGQLEWIIDPIDGTSNFVHGFPMFSISIAAVIDAEVVAGVVVDPNSGDEYSADARGAYLNGQPLRPRPGPPDASQYNVVTSFPAAEILHRAPGASQLFGDLVTSFATVRRFVSGALELCYAARGLADVVLGIDTKPWDIAAGSYILRQAGGTYYTGVSGPQHLAPHYLALAPGRASTTAFNIFDTIRQL